MFLTIRNKNKIILKPKRLHKLLKMYALKSMIIWQRLKGKIHFKNKNTK